MSIVSIPSAQPAAEPDGAPRIASLDVLRGLAILAILFLNIGDMGASMTATGSDIRHLGWLPADRAVWWLREVFLTGTARGLLEMLFGAGMMILTARAASLRDYVRRNLILLLFGLAHVFVLLWPGDILHTYAIAALIAVIFRRVPPAGLILIGLALASLQTLGSIAPYTADLQRHARAMTLAEKPADATPQQRKADSDDRQARAASAAATAREIATEDRARTGAFASWAMAAWDQFLSLERDGYEGLWVWEAASTMLIGAALFRLGVLQGQVSRRTYWLLLAAGYGFGLGMRAVGATETMRFDDAPNPLWLVAEFARLAVTMGHVAAVQLALRTSVGNRLLRPFAAAGRTALSIYVAQTLLCGWLLFSPAGFGLYGRLGWAGLMAVAALVDGLLLAAAILYVRRWRIGPVEWAWRSLAAGRRLAWR